MFNICLPATSITLTPPPPPSDFLLSRISFWRYIIVRWGLFPKNSLTPCGEKKFLIGSQDLAVRGVLKYKVDMNFIIFREFNTMLEIVNS